jgi:uncharacterized Fe-S cluster protein YjdI
MNRAFVSAIGALLALIATPAEPADLWRGAHPRHAVHAPPVVYGPQVVYGVPEPLCYWCIRDDIYADTKLIAHLEANPDVDEADKAPWILGAHADVRRLRRILEPVETVSVAPCCYFRKRLYVR